MTPGPWRFRKGGSVTHAVVLGLKGVVAIFKNKCDEDDLRLMAAAPDLLAVVQELADSSAYWSEYDVPLGIADRIRAAIAKAEGATPDRYELTEAGRAMVSGKSEHDRTKDALANIMGGRW